MPHIYKNKNFYQKPLIKNQVYAIIYVRREYLYEKQKNIIYP